MCDCIFPSIAMVWYIFASKIGSDWQIRNLHKHSGRHQLRSAVPKPHTHTHILHVIDKP